MNFRYLHCEILWWSSSDCQTYSCQSFFERSGERCGFMLCGMNNANVIVLFLKDVTFVYDDKIFPSSDIISPESNTQVFRNCKYLSLSLPFSFHTSSFQKCQYLSTITCYLSFSQSTWLLFFFLSSCALPTELFPLTGNLLSGWRDGDIFSSSDFVLQLRTMAWWLRSRHLA